MMSDLQNWRDDGVRVVRGDALRSERQAAGRAAAFEFAGGEAGDRTWVGTASMPPSMATGPHHHGRVEIALHVLGGKGRIRWGQKLEYAADIGPGDFIYFAPFVPHEEINLSDKDTLDLMVIRSDVTRVVVPIDTTPVEHPEMLY